ncbi:hypothetical protein [Vibrio splendidus]|uniref:GIY-YIG domain-containing protein n=1 Tax=Vibrio splendidus TaxID=29497 RepID=A0A2T5E573_VIBSP|nr:hypothetical protein [Vibrio splendidus]OEE60128.1 hypothetical protein A147_03855 [Vibrio splendidus FF-6]PTP14448.1 hypothetical protein CWO36_21185 [Vibrio splendidus]UOE82169.1 hypothetical protein LTQ03_15680 [Vibrio splendidus]
MRTNQYIGSDGQYHFVYVSTITDNQNVKYRYVGKHSTSNIKDGYVGSGTAIKQAKGKGLHIECKPFLFFDCEELAEIYESYWLEQLQNDKAVVNIRFDSHNTRVAKSQSDEMKKRQKEGIAKAKGKFKGRKATVDNELIRETLATGLSMRKTAEKLGYSLSTVQRATK